MGIGYSKASVLDALRATVASSVVCGPLAPISLTTVALAAIELREHLRAGAAWSQPNFNVLKAISALLDHAVAAPEDALICVSQVAQLFRDME